jgi:alanine-glyoxylate transaminase/serine-glyoxylate transaminase/serine-pyruvate transaminase
VPGISPISFSTKAVEKLTSRKSKVPSWFLDLSLVMGYWGGTGKRSYHHTAPVNSLYALHESLVMLQDEGLENAWQRHKNQHLKLKTGLEKLGIAFVVEEQYRLPQLNTVLIPQGVDDAAVRQTLLNEYNLEIGAGLGGFAGKAWRIGLMGYAARTENVTLCLAALADVLEK